MKLPTLRIVFVFAVLVAWPQSPAPSSRTAHRASPSQHQAADARRRERRSVFLARRHAADLPVHARRLSLRSDLHDEDRRHRPAQVSTGTGRTTCGYFYPGGKQILFASTHEASPACPPKPSYERGYVWPIYAGYDIYRANADGSNLTPLTRTPGYDAEATIAPDGLIVFTSVRDGDMEIYSMKADGSDVQASDQPSRS